MYLFCLCFLPAQDKCAQKADPVLLLTRVILPGTFEVSQGLCHRHAGLHQQDGEVVMRIRLPWIPSERGPIQGLCSLQFAELVEPDGLRQCLSRVEGGQVRGRIFLSGVAIHLMTGCAGSQRSEGTTL